MRRIAGWTVPQWITGIFVGAILFALCMAACSPDATFTLTCDDGTQYQITHIPAFRTNGFIGIGGARIFKAADVGCVATQNIPEDPEALPYP